MAKNAVRFVMNAMKKLEAVPIPVPSIPRTPKVEAMAKKAVQFVMKAMKKLEKATILGPSILRTSKVKSRAMKAAPAKAKSPYRPGDKDRDGKGRFLSPTREADPKLKGLTTEVALLKAKLRKSEKTQKEAAAKEDDDETPPTSPKTSTVAASSRRRMRPRRCFQVEDQRMQLPWPKMSLMTIISLDATFVLCEMGEKLHA